MGNQITKDRRMEANPSKEEVDPLAPPATPRREDTEDEVDAIANGSLLDDDDDDDDEKEEDDDDDDDWYLTTGSSSMGNISSSFPQSSVLAEPSLVQSTIAENNHGVLALKEAAARQQQQKEQRCWSTWLKPQQPPLVWMAEHERETSSFLEKEDERQDTSMDAEDENDEPTNAPTKEGHRNRQSASHCHWFGMPCDPNRKNNHNNMKRKNRDSRSGMLLWTTNSASNCSLTATSASTSSSSSSLSSSSWFANDETELEYTNSERELSAVEPTPASELSSPRHVWIVTTAALPWMTGTAVNPLLRAGSLWQHYQDQVEAQQQRRRDESAPTSSQDFSITLVLPWLCRAKDREGLYGPHWKDKSVEDQEAYIRSWLSERAKLPRAAQHIAIQWYTAHYHPHLSSIFAVDDVCDACLNVPSDHTAVVVLEEPEHLNCYRGPGKATWGQRFGHVIGIVHTNYRAYAQSHASGLVMGPLVGAIFASLVRTYCDKVIKLSDVLQSYSPEKQVTCNVHGIRDEFLQMPPPTGNKVYFIGKLLWAKGLDKMLTLQARYKKATGSYFALDVYGSGPQQDEIKLAFLGKQQQQQARRWTSSASSVSREPDDDSSSKEEDHGKQPSSPKMPVEFMGRMDHAALSSEYKVFVNPSITEVLCTTTAEALAMGRFVIIPHHASNHFFSQFPNCLQYQPHKYYEFCVLLQYALTHTPTPLSAEHTHLLTWEAATDRFIKASAVSLRDAARRERLTARQGREERFAQFHEDMCKGTSGVFVRTLLHGDDPHKTTTLPTTPQHSASAPQEEDMEDEEEEEKKESEDVESTTSLGTFSSFSWFQSSFSSLPVRT